MRRPALATLALTLALATSAAAEKVPLPDRVQARGTEFDLTLSKQKLRPGRAIVQFLNDGEDAHDLRVQRVGETGAGEGPELTVGVVSPGEYANLDVHLRKRSIYVLWCSLGDHRERGMEAALRTKKRRG
jgi:hypothetical protein